MARVVIDFDGTKRYYNDEGQFHREDGPAIIWRNGAKWWYKNDWLSSETHPSAMTSKGVAQWCINHHINKRNGPAYDRPNGHKEWEFGWGIAEWPKL